MRASQNGPRQCGKSCALHVSLSMHTSQKRLVDHSQCIAKKFVLLDAVCGRLWQKRLECYVLCSRLKRVQLVLWWSLREDDVVKLSLTSSIMSGERFQLVYITCFLLKNATLRKRDRFQAVSLNRALLSSGFVTTRMTGGQQERVFHQQFYQINKICKKKSARILGRKLLEY